jgi:hypothetical protein
MKFANPHTCRGKDALKLQRFIFDSGGDVFIKDAAKALRRSVAYTRSVAEEYGFTVDKLPRGVSSWLVGLSEDTQTTTNCDRLHKELAEAKQRIAESEQDKRRLDWFDSHEFSAYHQSDPEYGLDKHCVVVDEQQTSRHGCVGTIRQAIDQAERESNE